MPALISLLAAAVVGVAFWGAIALAGFWLISAIVSPPRTLAAAGVVVWLVAAAGSIVVAVGLAVNRSDD